MTPQGLDLGPMSHVEHHVDGQRSTLVFVRHIGHTPDKVWEALTDPTQLKEWAPFEPDRNLASPGPAVLRMRDGQVVEEYACEVREAIAPRLLVYTWGDDLLRWELRADGEGTSLTLRHTVDSVEWMSRTAAGWHICLVVAERLLAGDPAGPIVGRDAKAHGWEQLNEAYAARLGLDSQGWPSEVFPDEDVTPERS